MVALEAVVMFTFPSFGSLFLYFYEVWSNRDGGCSLRELRTGARNSRSGPGRTMATGMGKKVAVGTGGRPKKAKPVDTTSKKIRDRGGRR